jgi:hypothetical protein
MRLARAHFIFPADELFVSRQAFFLSLSMGAMGGSTPIDGQRRIVCAEARSGCCCPPRIFR